jgi:acyl-CoA ligase (AMP-forming) (exosortase A-associated)
MYDIAVTLLHHLLASSVERFADRTALRQRGRELTYSELYDRSRRLAGGLAACGIGRRDRVAVYLQNRIEVVEVALACSMLGAIFVPANSQLKNRQLQHLLQDCGAYALVTSQAAASNLDDVLRASTTVRTVITCDSLPGDVEPHGAIAYDSLFSAIPLAPEPRAIDADAAAILYTSGSTGRPKGVVVSHRNLVSGARCVAGYIGNVPDDRLLVALPLSFDYGFSQVTTAIVSGACAVITQFSTSTALIQEIGTESITGLAGVPMMWVHLAEQEWPAGVGDTLRYVTNSGGAMPHTTLMKLRAKIRSARIFCMYGLTEAFRSTYLEPEQLAARSGSIGKAIPGQEVLVLRPDGSRCAPGEIGELVHRGSLVTLGYWANAEATQHRYRKLPSMNPGCLEETAVWSGDLVRADEDGYLWFIGRNDQLIKTSGHRVSPTEIEEVALEVQGVIEALAIGMPDRVLGQRIVLALIVRDSTDDIVETVRQHLRRQLPPYMVPAQFCRVAAIPRNPNGKQDRVATLRELQPQIVAEPETPQLRHRSSC